jgi:hypothetical protein
MPDGYFFLVDLSGSHAELETEAGLGWTHLLYWADREELAQPETIILRITT